MYHGRVPYKKKIRSSFGPSCCQYLDAWMLGCVNACSLIICTYDWQSQFETQRTESSTLHDWILALRQKVAHAMQIKNSYVTPKITIRHPSHYGFTPTTFDDIIDLPRPNSLTKEIRSSYVHFLLPISCSLDAFVNACPLIVLTYDWHSQFQTQATETRLFMR